MKRISAMIILSLGIFNTAIAAPTVINTKSYFNSCDDSYCVFNLAINVEHSGYVLNNAQAKESQDIKVITSNCDNSKECLIMIKTRKINQQIHLVVSLNDETKEIIYSNKIPDYYW